MLWAKKRHLKERLGGGRRRTPARALNGWGEREREREREECAL